MRPLLVALALVLGGCQAILGIGETTSRSGDAAVGDMPDAAVVAPPDAAVVTAPDAAVTTADATVTTPDAAVTTPDAAVTAPDARPDAAVTQPDAAVATPDSALISTDSGSRPDASTGPRDAAVADAMPGGVITIFIKPQYPRVVRGTTVQVLVQIVRRPDFADDITVTLMNLPAQVTATPLVFTADAVDEQPMMITAGGNAAVGTFPIRVHATGGTATYDLTTTLVVAAQPGTLDVTFGGGTGSSTASLAAAAHAIAVDSEDHILVGGTTKNGLWFIARLSPNGALDPSYGFQGVRLSAAGQLRGLVVLGDRSVVALGTVGTSITLRRFTSDGGDDPDFGVGGTAVPWPEVGGRSDGNALVTVGTGSDRRLIAVGVVYTAQEEKSLGCALHLDGSLDSDFASGGCRVGADKTHFSAATTGAGDSIYFAGDLGGSTPMFHAVAVDSGGTLLVGFNGGDTTWGGDGKRALAASLQTSGALVVAGYAAGPQPADRIAVLSRLTPEGIVDTDFGDVGIVTPQPSTMTSQFNGLVTLSSGRLVAVGQPSAAAGFIYVLEPDGTPAASFGNLGTLSLPGWQFDAVTTDRFGRLLVVGANGQNAAIMRIWP